MTLRIPKWLLSALVVLLVAGAGIAVVLLVLDDDGGTGGDAGVAPSEPATSDAELAEIESAINKWEVIFDGISERAHTCGVEARNGTVDRETCYAEEVRGKMDAASERLAIAFAALRPQVGSACAKALAQAGNNVMDPQSFSLPREITRPCRAVSDGE